MLLLLQIFISYTQSKHGEMKLEDLERKILKLLITRWYLLGNQQCAELNVGGGWKAPEGLVNQWARHPTI